MSNITSHDASNEFMSSTKKEKEKKNSHTVY